MTNALSNKIMYQTGLMKTHFMFGGMHVHIDVIRIEIDKQHKGRILIVT